MSNSELIISMWFFRGVLYGLIMMSTIGLWAWFDSTDFFGYDHEKEVTTYKIKKTPTPRLFFIVTAGMVWPLTLALVLLYGLFRIPILIYRKTERYPCKKK